MILVTLSYGIGTHTLQDYLAERIAAVERQKYDDGPVVPVKVPFNDVNRLPDRTRVIFCFLGFPFPVRWLLDFAFDCYPLLYVFMLCRNRIGRHRVVYYWQLMVLFFNLIPVSCQCPLPVFVVHSISPSHFFSIFHRLWS